MQTSAQNNAFYPNIGTSRVYDKEFSKGHLWSEMLLCNYRDVIIKLWRFYYAIMEPSHLFLAVINYS